MSSEQEMILFILIVFAIGMIFYGVSCLGRKKTEDIDEADTSENVKMDLESPSVRYSDNLSKASEGVLYKYTEDKVMWVCDNCETENVLTENECRVCGFRRS